jgi:REP element-mobilizing transposase RayT
MILNKLGKVVEEEWMRTKEIRKNVDLDYYIIMPNHLHGIIIIEQSIEKNNFKSASNTTENVGATRRVAQKEEDGAIQRIAPTKETLIPNSLGSIIGQFKSKVTKRLREISGNSDLKIWQRNYYEHILRNEIDLQNIRKYITLNPLRWEIDEYFNS